jgi:hypothetical protein
MNKTEITVWKGIGIMAMVFAVFFVILLFVVSNIVK